MTDPIQDAAREAIDKWFSDIQLYRRDQLDSIVASAIREQVALAVAGAYEAVAQHAPYGTGGCTCGFWVSKTNTSGLADQEEWRAHIRALTPADAAKALAERERVVRLAMRDQCATILRGVGENARSIHECLELIESISVETELEATLREFEKVSHGA